MRGEFFEREVFADFDAVVIAPQSRIRRETAFESGHAVGNDGENFLVGVCLFVEIAQRMFAVAARERRVDFCQRAAVFDIARCVFEFARPIAQARFVIFNRLLEHREEPIAWRHGKELGVDGDEDAEIVRRILPQEEADISLEEALFLFGVQRTVENNRIELADKSRHSRGDAPRFDALQENDGFRRFEIVEEVADARLDFVSDVVELEQGFVGAHEFFVVVLNRELHLMAGVLELLAEFFVFRARGFEHAVDIGALRLPVFDRQFVAKIDGFVIGRSVGNGFFGVFERAAFVSRQPHEHFCDARPDIGKVVAGERFRFEHADALAQFAARSDF